MAPKNYNIISNPSSINPMVLTSLETGWLAGKNIKCSEVSEFQKGPVYSIYLKLIICWMPKSGVSISTDYQWNMPATLLTAVGYFFPQKRCKIVVLKMS